MSNPINNSTFDSKDLISYKESLEEELVDNWNTYFLNFEDDDFEEIVDFDEVDLEHEGFKSEYSEEIDEYESIKHFHDELENYGDFIHGATIIADSYFKDYCKASCEDHGEIPKNLPRYIENNIDWQGVADDLKADYMEARYNGVYYLLRA